MLPSRRSTRIINPRPPIITRQTPLRFSIPQPPPRIAKPTLEIPADKILDSKDLNDVFPLLRPTDMLGLDLDETIIEMPQMLGRTVWFEWHLAILCDKYKADFARALDETVVIYNKIHAHTLAQAVQEETATLVHEFHKLCNSVIAITSRGAQLQDHTPRQLACAKITFKTGKHGAISMQFNASEFSSLHEGIMYCSGGKNKPACFAEFIQTLPETERPKRLVFIDDKRSYIEDMRNKSEQLNIEFLGIHYRRIEHKIAEFDPAIATKQLEVFAEEARLISDDEARALLSMQNLWRDAKKARLELR